MAVHAGDFISVNEFSGGTHNLKYKPSANANDLNTTPAQPSFTFQVQDDGGTLAGGVDLDQSPNTMTFDVIPLNDAPVGHAFSQSIAEDGSYTFTAADFASATPGVFDPNDTPANSFQAAALPTLPANGTLLLNSVGSMLCDFVRVSEINANHLVFVPSADANGTNYGNFTFQVQDNGGTAFGGVDLDPTAAWPQSMSRRSAMSRPARTAAPRSTKTASTRFPPATSASPILHDQNPPSTDATDPDTLDRVKITTLPTNGSLLRFNGTAEVAVSTGDFILASDIASGRLRFAPTANQHGIPTPQ